MLDNNPHAAQFVKLNRLPYIEFRPIGEDFELAAKRSEQMGVLANSFTRGEGRMAGMLGEIAIEKLLHGQISYLGSKSKAYDLQALSGETIEVKTKRAGRIPELDYNASVDHKQTFMFQNDLFVFLRCHSSLNKLWILGWLTTRSFKRMATFKKAGESDGAGFAFRSDNWVLPIGKLKPMQGLLDRLNG